jgi:O-antigen ligase
MPELNLALFKKHPATALLVMFAFFLPIFQTISILSLVGLIFVWISTGNVGGRFRSLLRDPFTWVFISFYLVHVIGLLYSTDMPYATADLQTKFSFLLFPLLLPAIVKAKQDWTWVRRAFILGNLPAVLICLGAAIYRFMNDGDIGDFFYMRYSILHHPTYFSFYLNIAILFILEEVFLTRGIQRKKLIVLLILGFFFFLNILLLSARTAIAVSYLTIFLFPFFRWGKSFFNSRRIIIWGSALLLVAASHRMLLEANNRFQQVVNVLEKINPPSPQAGEAAVTPPEENSTSAHFRLWKNGWVVFLQHPVLGVGTGDLKEELRKQYAIDHFDYALKYNLSPHDQFLHTAVLLGLLRLIALLAMLLVPLWLAFRSKDWLYVFLIGVIILNATTESILEVQKGVLFFAFFNAFLFLQLRQESPASHN